MSNDIFTKRQRRRGSTGSTDKENDEMRKSLYISSVYRRNSTEDNMMTRENLLDKKQHVMYQFYTKEVVKKKTKQNVVNELIKRRNSTGVNSIKGNRKSSKVVWEM